MPSRSNITVNELSIAKLCSILSLDIPDDSSFAWQDDINLAIDPNAVSKNVRKGRTGDQRRKSVHTHARWTRLIIKPRRDLWALDLFLNYPPHGSCLTEFYPATARDYEVFSLARKKDVNLWPYTWYGVRWDLFLDPCVITLCLLAPPLFGCGSLLRFKAWNGCHETGLNHRRKVVFIKIWNLNKAWSLLESLEAGCAHMKNQIEGSLFMVKGRFSTPQSPIIGQCP